MTVTTFEEILEVFNKIYKKQMKEKKDEVKNNDVRNITKRNGKSNERRK